MSTPRRVRRKRTKGYKMPKGVVYVGRPTKYANPYRVDKQLPKSVRYEAAVGLFRSYALLMLESDPHWLDPLRGKDLACWCALKDAEGKTFPCHADVLLELAK